MDEEQKKRRKPLDVIVHTLSTCAELHQENHHFKASMIHASLKENREKGGRRREEEKRRKEKKKGGKNSHSCLLELLGGNQVI